jgi:hypothetical protein
MEAFQIIVYNNDFIINFIFSLFLFSFFLLFIFIIIKETLARLVLSFGYLCYAFPLLIIKPWQNEEYDLAKYSICIVVFFLTVIFFYFIFNSFLKLFSNRKNLKKKSSKFFLKVKKTNIEAYRKYIIYVFLFTSIFIIIYFNTIGKSGFNFWIMEGQGTIARMEIYKNPAIFQYLFVIYSRILVLLSILIVKKKHLLLILLIASLASINSLERQAIFIIMAGTIFRFFLDRSLITFLTVLLSLALVLFNFIIRESIVIFSSDTSSIIFESIIGLISVIVNRIVYDPMIMLHSVIQRAEGQSFYLLNNSIINFIFSNLFNDISYDELKKWTAIGIIPDGYKIFSNQIGVFLTGIWFAFLLSFCCYLLKKISNRQIKNIIIILLFSSLVSFYYSNILSITPLSIIFSLYFLIKFTPIQNVK